jgi:DNA-binding NtrC family response regulator
MTDRATRVIERGDLIPTSKKGKLIVLSGPSRGKEYVVGQDEVLVGTGANCDFSIKDDAVSKKHFLIQRGKNEFTIADQGSTNGTVLNGNSIKVGGLKPNSIIQIGESYIQFFLYDENEAEYGVSPTEKDYFGSVYGGSYAMRKIFGVLEKVSPTNVTIVLEGATGVGKDVIARAVHANSRRASEPFIVVDCTAISPNLFESELFGHEKGSFTGAESQRRGLLEVAKGGTIFFDELGELPIEQQPKLLRAIETRSIKRVGGNEEIPIDIRIIAATNRDLETEVKKGNFREDLYFRLSVVKILVPDLKDRSDDIPGIVDHFINNTGKSLSDDALNLLKYYSWPGNIRELKNVIERAVAFAEGEVIESKDIMTMQQIASATASSTQTEEESFTGRSLEALEKIAIEKTIEACSGNKTKAAKILGIAYSTLYEKIKKYGIET